MSCPEYHPGLKLCQRGYCSARAKYKRYPSAYASKVCKGQALDINGLVQADPEYIQPEDSKLKRWLDEEWVNVCHKKEDGTYYKCCQHQKEYPYCRPLHRISDQTPKTLDQISPQELEQLCQEKQGAKTNRIFVDSNAFLSPTQEVQEYLNNPPSTWQKLFTSHGLPEHPTIDQVITTFLSKTAGGKNSHEEDTELVGDIPEQVREEALKGVRLSYTHNYPSYEGIGLARAIQLVTQDKIHSESKRRMCAFFSRNKRYQKMKGFGDDQRPSKSYLAWLNWGGDAGYDWACN